MMIYYSDIRMPRDDNNCNLYIFIYNIAMPYYYYFRRVTRNIITHATTLYNVIILLRCISVHIGNGKLCPSVQCAENRRRVKFVKRYLARNIYNNISEQSETTQEKFWYFFFFYHL